MIDTHSFFYLTLYTLFISWEILRKSWLYLSKPLPFTLYVSEDIVVFDSGSPTSVPPIAQGDSLSVVGEGREHPVSKQIALWCSICQACPLPCVWRLCDPWGLVMGWISAVFFCWALFSFSSEKCCFHPPAHRLKWRRPHFYSTSFLGPWPT